jgi:hypothetical protein
LCRTVRRRQPIPAPSGCTTNAVASVVAPPGPTLRTGAGSFRDTHSYLRRTDRSQRGFRGHRPEYEFWCSARLGIARSLILTVFFLVPAPCCLLDDSHEVFGIGTEDLTDSISEQVIARIYASGLGRSLGSKNPAG